MRATAHHAQALGLQAKQVLAAGLHVAAVLQLAHQAVAALGEVGKVQLVHHHPGAGSGFAPGITLGGAGVAGGEQQWCGSAASVDQAIAHLAQVAPGLAQVQSKAAVGLAHLAHFSAGIALEQ